MDVLKLPIIGGGVLLLLSSIDYILIVCHFKYLLFYV